MKKCKKLLCLVLALVMALSLCTVAMADDPAADGTTSPISSVLFRLNKYYYGGLATEVAAEASTPGVTCQTEDLCTYDDDGSYYVLDGNYWITEFDQLYLKVTFKATEADGTSLADSFTNSNLTLNIVKYNSDGTSDGTTLLNASPITAESSTVENGVAVAYFKLPEVTKRDYTKEIELTKNVERKGNVAPGATSFQLEILSISDTTDDQDPADYVTVTDSFTYTPGTSNYTIKITGPKAMVDQYIEDGFFVREKAHADDAWECDDAIWFVHMHAWGTDGNTTRLTCTVADEWNVEPKCNLQTNPPVHCEHDTKLTFTNIYTENVTHEHTRRQPSTPATPEAPIASPKTGDMGVALYAAMALLSMSGSAVILGKKRSK